MAKHAYGPNAKQREANEDNNQDEEDMTTEEPTPEPSPVGPPAPHEPPSSPLHGWTDTDDDDEIEPHNDYSDSEQQGQNRHGQREEHTGGMKQNKVFWRNSPKHNPRISTRSEEESFASFPSAPSPPSSRTGSISYQDRSRRNNKKKKHSNSRGRSNKDSPPVDQVQIKSPQKNEANYDEDENDTFYDDRSLEMRLYQVLDRKPSFANPPIHETRNSPVAAAAAYSEKAKSRENNVTKKNSAKSGDNHVPNSDSHLPDHLYTVLEHDDVNISASKMLRKELERLSLAVQDLTLANERLLRKENKSKTEYGKGDDQARDKEECKRLSHELQRIQTVLNEEKDMSASKILELTTYKKELEEGIEIAGAKILALEEEKLSSEQNALSLSRENEEFQREIRLIKEENAALKQKIDSLESTMQTETSAKSSAMDRIQELNKEITSFQQQISALVGRESESIAQISKLRDENNVLRETINGLRQELGVANERIRESTVVVDKKYEVNSPTSTLLPVYSESHSESQDSSRTTVEEKKDDLHGVERVSHASSSSSTAARRGRLSRIRDATERAALSREHQKEIAQLLAKHEAEVERVTVSMNELRERDGVIASARMNDVEQNLRAEFEVQRAELEKKHELEMKKLKENTDFNLAKAAKSIESVLTKASSVEKRYEEEARKRGELEAEKLSMAEKHAREMQANREYWESERDAMISGIKRECNFVFENSKSWTPKSEATSSLGFFSHRQEILRDDEGSRSMMPSIVSTSPRESNSGSSQILSTDLSHSLRETEALVESILNHTTT